MNFTHNNHLKYTIGNQLYGNRIDGKQKFHVTVGAIDKDHYAKSNYQSELRRTADLVYKDFGKDFALFLSGGTDSEIVARNFLSIGVKPKCFTIRFKNDYNLSDVQEAIELSSELDLPINIIDFDVKEFVKSGEAVEFGNELQCTQVTYLMVYNCIKKLGLPSVMGGELLLQRLINAMKTDWYYCFRENEDASAIRFSLKYNIPLVNEWFSYTPELMLYYLTDIGIQTLINTKFNYKLSSVSSKNAILKRLMPEIRTRNKTHGFEQLLAFNHESYRKLTSTQIMRTEKSLDGILYDDILVALKGSYEHSKVG